MELRIKGFDKDLKCKNMQFEVGKEYKIDSKKLKLCSNTVFHYCKTIRQVHNYYDVTADNRFCWIEVLGEEVTDGEKCGSNHIKIVREIVGEELNFLTGRINGNTGIFNTGNSNTGDFNTGDFNTGSCNTGSCNTGSCNTGSCNTGSFNTGYSNTGFYNTGNHNKGDDNTGNYNTGHYNTENYNTGDSNTGNCNSGDFNTGSYNTGDSNTGYCNTGNFNTGSYNTGDFNTGNFNKCNFSSGFFCTQEPKARIFDIETNMTVTEFRVSKWCEALYSAPFVLTEWIYYTDKERADDKDKELTVCYLKCYTYKEACTNWWAKMSDEDKEIIKTIPNFNAEKFYEITGIDVRN